MTSLALPPVIDLSSIGNKAALAGSPWAENGAGPLTQAIESMK
jgi:hypothetical protein